MLSYHVVVVVVHFHPATAAVDIMRVGAADMKLAVMMKSGKEGMRPSSPSSDS